MKHELDQDHPIIQRINLWSAQFLIALFLAVLLFFATKWVFPNAHKGLLTAYTIGMFLFVKTIFLGGKHK